MEMVYLMILCNWRSYGYMKLDAFDRLEKINDFLLDLWDLWSYDRF